METKFRILTVGLLILSLSVLTACDADSNQIQQSDSPDGSLYQDINAVYYQETDTNGTVSGNGVFRFDGVNKWNEYKINSVNSEESLFATYVEIRRDSNGILIYDIDRDTTIRLAINSREIVAVGGASSVIYIITDAPTNQVSNPTIDPTETPVGEPVADPVTVPAEPPAPTVDSEIPPDETPSNEAPDQEPTESPLFMDINAVYYKVSDENGELLTYGVFRFDGNNKWLEYKIDPTTRDELLFATFAEVRRSDSGILIYDALRDLSIRLSINTGEIFAGQGDTANGLLFLISEEPDDTPFVPTEDTTDNPAPEPEDPPADDPTPGTGGDPAQNPPDDPDQEPGETPGDEPTDTPTPWVPEVPEDPLYQDITEVFYAENNADGELIGYGVFRFDGLNQWHEYKIRLNTREEQLAAIFSEVQRDITGILMYDASRDLSIRLSIETGEIFAGSGNTANGLLFRIIDESEDSTSTLYDGITAVFYDDTNGDGELIGYGVFRFDGTDLWQEYKIDLQTQEERLAATFTEVRRDASGILMYDAGRNLSIRLSINTAEIFVGVGDTADGLLFFISRVLGTTTALATHQDSFQSADKVSYARHDENGYWLSGGVLEKHHDNIWYQATFEVGAGYQPSTSSLAEYRRDAYGIFLRDTSVDRIIRLDINCSAVSVGSHESALKPLYGLSSTIGRTTPGSLYYYQDTSTTRKGTASGILYAGTNGLWKEYRIGPSGKPLMTRQLTQDLQKHSSVVLYDALDGLTLRLDIQNQIIYSGDGSGNANNASYRIVRCAPGPKLDYH